MLPLNGATLRMFFLKPSTNPTHLIVLHILTTLLLWGPRGILKVFQMDVLCTGFVIIILYFSKAIILSSWGIYLDESKLFPSPLCWSFCIITCLTFLWRLQNSLWRCISFIGYDIGYEFMITNLCAWYCVPSACLLSVSLFINIYAG
jgi:hypothetical protein